jgi:type I restriction enzyme R subunit
VDIISMVKNAVLDTSPLYTAEERVDLAVERVTAGRQLTDDQALWMQYIRDHLVQNLSIDRDDFDLVPVLSNRGGWSKANQVFDRQLEALLADLNKELVAA